MLFLNLISNVYNCERNEGALDLCVIKVPEERKYVEHFIICTPRNDSQLVSIPGNLAECEYFIFIMYLVITWL